MKIKTTMRYHLIQVRMAIIKMSTSNKFWRGCALLWECKLIQPLWKMVWRFLKNLGMKPPYDPAIPLLSIVPKETRVKNDTCILLFIAALFTMAKNMEAT